MDPLSSEEINILINALTVWEKDEERDALQLGIFETLFAGVAASSPAERDQALVQAKAKRDKTMDRAVQTTKMRRETSVIIQAKLLMMRNEALRQEIT